MKTRAARALIHSLLSRIRTGELVLVEGRRRTVFGHGAPRATVHVRDPRTWTALLRGGRGLAESYREGWWDTPDLVAVIRVAARNVTGLDEVRRRCSALREPYQRLRNVAGNNTRERSRRDIAAHYDLGNELFALMLDERMMYSSAYFAQPQMTLDEAALAKLELVCCKLDLGPRDHVVEIGTGWGGFAVHAAATRGCRVTTTTISAEQHAFAVARVREAGLEDRVTVLLEDYRDLTGRYDKLVSLEMVEAVGWRDFGTFFSRCAELLEPQGAMLLQAITIDDRAFAVEKASRSFIRTYVFPNGCLPSPEVIARCVSRETDLHAVDHQDMTPHYAETLRHWRERAEAARDDLEGLGYDERFRRLWRLYLAYCEAGFAERRIQVGQTVLAKPGWRGEVHRPGELLVAPPAAVHAVEA